MTKNKIKTTGRIIRIKEKPSGAKILIVASKSSKNIVLKYICEKALELDESIQENSVVSIEGYVRAYSIKQGEKWTTTQYIKADKIIPLVAGYDENGEIVQRKYYSSYEISGTVVSIKEDENNWQRLTVRVDEDNDKRNTSYVHLNWRIKEDNPTRVEKFDVITAICNIATPIKEIRGQKMYFEDFLVSDISVIN